MLSSTGLKLIYYCHMKL